MISSDRPKSVENLTTIASVSSPTKHTSSQYDPSGRFPHRPRYDSRRSSTASSINGGVGGALDSSLHHGSITEAGHNAISTLLQQPIVRTGLLPHASALSSGYKPPTTRDIPPVTLTNIPHVDPKAFQPYLSQVGSLYDTLRGSKEHGEERDPLLFRTSSASSLSGDVYTLLSGQLERRLSGQQSSLTPVSEYSTPRRRSSGQRARGPATAPLSTIPSVYFDEDFHLENPRTFDIVSERSEVVRSLPKPSDEKAPNGAFDSRPSSSRKALATNAILQEKLSWYLDTVEIHLISSISTASTSFFAALGSLQELHREATDSVQKIQALRKDLAKLDNDMALGGLKVVSLRRRRENVRKLADAVCQLKEVITCVARCEQMVENGDIENALDELDNVERLTAGEQVLTSCDDRLNESQLPETLLDLRGIKALEGASHDLSQLRHRIGLGYERQFLDYLIGDLRRHVESIPPDLTLLRLGDASQRSRRGHRRVVSGLPTYMTVDSGFRSGLRTELAGLGRAKYTAPAATSFKSAVLREMKNAIRRHLPSSSDDDNESIMSSSTHGGRRLNQQEKSSILARNLRALDPDDAFLMLTKIYTSVSESLRRLSVQVKVLLDITSGLSSPPSTGGIRSPGRSPSLSSLDAISRSRATPVIAQEEILEVLDMSSLLGQAVDIVQSQMVKVLKVRSEQIAHGSLEQFLRYFSLNKLFADECEAISGRSGAALKNVVDTQIKEFISNFGDSSKHKIVQVMDSDRWDAKDFGDEENALLSRILRASTQDIELWVSTSRIWESEDGSQESTTVQDNSEVNGNGVSSTGKDKVRGAVVDDQKYILPRSALLILKIIDEFEHLMTGIPSMVHDIALNFLECLKLFNSRSSQLILGAGATRSAGLKNITTKHLALASQALSFITALIPYIREFIRRYHTSATLMAEFDKVKRLYQEHQSGIHEKLVDIMSSRASIHANSMKKIDWDQVQDTSAVSPYMETLTKETGTLHRVLAKHLPESTVMMIMDPVFASYREQWTKAFQAAALKTESGKERMISDVQYFKTKMDKIDGSGNLGDYLLGIVQAKSIASPPKPESPPSPPIQEVDQLSPPVEKNGDPDSDES
ncbi:vacuolar sorting-associated protein [Histoplasma ohiense]|nr:vacuolar sorting-associated protein [Histoplasma ohiense (nom. inval.)]